MANKVFVVPEKVGYIAFFNYDKTPHCAVGHLLAHFGMTWNEATGYRPLAEKLGLSREVVSELSMSTIQEAVVRKGDTRANMIRWLKTYLPNNEVK